MRIDRRGREDRVGRGEADVDEPRAVDRRHLNTAVEVCAKRVHRGRIRGFLVFRHRSRHRVGTDDPEHAGADRSCPPGDRGAGDADHLQGSERHRRLAAELGRLREVEPLDGVLGEPGALQDAVLGLVVRFGIDPVDRVVGVHPGDHRDALVFDQQARRRPIERNRRVALQHHQRHDNREHADDDPPVPVDDGEPIEQVDLVTAAGRHGEAPLLLELSGRSVSRVPWLEHRSGSCGCSVYRDWSSLLVARPPTAETGNAGARRRGHERWHRAVERTGEAAADRPDGRPDGTADRAGFCRATRRTEQDGGRRGPAERCRQPHEDRDRLVWPDGEDVAQRHRAHLTTPAFLLVSYSQRVLFQHQFVRLWQDPSVTAASSLPSKTCRWRRSDTAWALCFPSCLSDDLPVSSGMVCNRVVPTSLLRGVDTRDGDVWTVTHVTSLAQRHPPHRQPARRNRTAPPPLAHTRTSSRNVCESRYTPTVQDRQLRSMNWRIARLERVDYDRTSRSARFHSWAASHRSSPNRSARDT